MNLDAARIVALVGLVITPPVVDFVFDYNQQERKRVFLGLVIIVVLAFVVTGVR